MTVAVAIYLYGDRLQPERISKTLGVQPSASQVKGGIRHGVGRSATDKAYAPAKAGLWKLAAENRPAALSDQINDVLRKIGNPPVPCDKLQDVETAILDIFVTDDNDDQSRKTVEIPLSKEDLLAISKLGLSVRITVM